MEGLTSSDCSGLCSDANTATHKYYSDVVGLKRTKDCKVCPPGYRGWQCKFALVPRLGHFKSDSGVLDERAHQYLKEGSDGSWSATKKEGDYAGSWPTAGAIPENAPKYPGRIQWDTMNEGFVYDPAKKARSNVGIVPDV